MTARKELLDFWAQREARETPLSDFFADAEVHGQPFGFTCDNCCQCVPEGYSICPHCGQAYDDLLPRQEVAVTEGRSIDRGERDNAKRDARSFASDARQLAVLACCWFLVGVVLRVWIRGLQVEWTLFLDWWQG